MKTVNSLSLRILTCCILASVACVDRTPPRFTSVPVVMPSPNPAFPLVAYVEFVTDVPSTAKLTVTQGDIRREIAFAEVLNQQHRLPILELKPDRTYAIQVEVTDGNGNSTTLDGPLFFSTPPLPRDFPPIEVSISDPERMEPGLTVFGVFRIPDEFGFTIAVDSAGEVVWYYHGDPALGALTPVGEGRFISMADHSEIIELNPAGNLFRRWHASRFPNNGKEKEIPPNSIPVDTDTFHHDMTVLPSGNFLVLGTELVGVDNFPSDLSNPASEKTKARLVSDLVIEFTPEGEILKQWKIRDLVDPDRYGFDSGSDVWDRWAYGNVEGGTKDWTHANSLFYAEEQNLVIVSLRHFDAVIAFSYETGRLVWILGNHSGWGESWRPFLLEPSGALQWQYHQHAARLTSDGKVLLFDNGNHRAWPPEEKQKMEDHYSRVVEFEVDPQQMKVTQAWAYGGKEGEDFFSSFVSEADQLPRTGNVLITDGGRTRTDKGELAAGEAATRTSARIVEVTRDPVPQKVFELIVEDKSEEKPNRWAIYRSDRVPGLQP